MKIKDKIKQVTKNNPDAVSKYTSVLNALNEAQTPENASSLINSIYKNGIIFGGRRTKKNKKQKGGFTYKPTSTRRSISSSQSPIRRFTKRHGKRYYKRNSKSSK